MLSEFQRMGYGGKRFAPAAAILGCVLAVLITPGGMATSGGIDEDVTGSMGCYCIGTVGNVNCDYRDQVTLADVALLIDYLYISGARLPNREEANINADPAGIIDISDIVMLIDHLFINGVELPLCPVPYNSPPDTRIVGFSEGVPFINSVEPHSIATGVRFRWTASDIVDHPYESPDFEFEYRLYGPYPDSLFELLLDSFVVPVFRTDDGQIFRFGQIPAAHFISCDTLWWPGGVREIICDTILIDTLEGATWFGWLDTLFDAENPAFVNNPDFYRVAAVSSDGGDAWTYDLCDSLYDLFADFPSDTTQEANFLFTVRAREPVDPAICDPTPAFRGLTVIDPKFERDILVMNWSASSHENKALEDSIKVYWDRTINSWVANNGLDGVVHFDPERDFEHVADYVHDSRMFGPALKYKVLIEIQDASVAGTWSAQGQPVTNVMAAMLVGANGWVAARVPLGSHGSMGSPAYTTAASPTYEYFFGVRRYIFPGWGSYIFDYYAGGGYGLPRVEDFIGAVPEYSPGWPDISIDTALLHHRYDWQGHIPYVPPYYDGFPYYPFLPDPGALPQVGWCEPTEDAEVLYRYVSLYGEEEHPYVPSRDYHGKPVMHRLDRGLFRSVHSNFTPLALEETTGQQMVDSVLNWLYEKWCPENTSKMILPEDGNGGQQVGRVR